MQHRCGIFLAAALVTLFCICGEVTGLGIGLKAGPARSNGCETLASGAQPDYPDYQKPQYKAFKTGYHADLTVTGRLTNLLAFQTEVGLTQKNCEDLDPGGYTKRYTETFLEIPALLKLTVPMGQSINLSLFAGPTFGINVHQYMKVYRDGEFLYGYNHGPSEWGQVGIVLGGGIGFGIGRGELGIDIRLSRDLLVMAEDAGYQTIALLVGYSLFLSDRH